MCSVSIKGCIVDTADSAAETIKIRTALSVSSADLVSDARLSAAPAKKGFLGSGVLGFISTAIVRDQCSSHTTRIERCVAQLRASAHVGSLTGKTGQTAALGVSNYAQ